MNAKVYTLAELQLATSSFSEENLLGDGSLGSVYKAEFPDGQVILYRVTIKLYTRFYHCFN